MEKTERQQQIDNFKVYKESLIGEKPAKNYNGKNPLWNTFKKLGVKIEIQYGLLKKGNHNFHIVMFYRFLAKNTVTKAIEADKKQ